MRKKIKCSCGMTVVLNTDKHKFRKKLCPKCRAVVDNEKPKTRILSMFQRKKKIRKKANRKRFIDRMRGMRMSWRQIEKRLVNYGKEEIDG